nr:hypothetical protein HK105_001872 [Polyrhizophydium stewartii]
MFVSSHSSTFMVVINSQKAMSTFMLPRFVIGSASFLSESADKFPNTYAVKLTAGPRGNVVSVPDTQAYVYVLTENFTGVYFSTDESKSYNGLLKHRLDVRHVVYGRGMRAVEVLSSSHPRPDCVMPVFRILDSLAPAHALHGYYPMTPQPMAVPSASGSGSGSLARSASRDSQELLIPGSLPRSETEPWSFTWSSDGGPSRGPASPMYQQQMQQHYQQMQQYHQQMQQRHQQHQQRQQMHQQGQQMHQQQQQQQQMHQQQAQQQQQIEMYQQQMQQQLLEQRDRTLPEAQDNSELSAIEGWVRRLASQASTMSRPEARAISQATVEDFVEALDAARISAALVQSGGPGDSAEDEQQNHMRARGYDGPPLVVADHDFDALAPTDLSFRKGDTIRVFMWTGARDAWWLGELNDHMGMFPSNYVSVVKIE